MAICPVVCIVIDLDKLPKFEKKGNSGKKEQESSVDLCP